LAALLVVTIINGFGLPKPASPAGSAGTELAGQPAPDFQLSDARGQSVSLASLRGKAVVLTFLYTNCPDECPLTTAKLRQAYEQLGSKTANVALVAITVDPERDTPQRLADYTAESGMVGRWEFLTGSRAQLSPVWAAYGIQPLTPGAASNSTGAPPVHTLATYLLDSQGRERRLLDPDFTVADLVGDLQSLML
jgi:protein SCO1/2